MKLSVHLTLTAWSFISREENELVSSPRQRQVAESGVGWHDRRHFGFGVRGPESRNWPVALCLRFLFRIWARKYLLLSRCEKYGQPTYCSLDGGWLCPSELEPNLSRYLHSHDSVSDTAWAQSTVDLWGIMPALKKALSGEKFNFRTPHSISTECIHVAGSAWTRSYNSEDLTFWLAHFLSLNTIYNSHWLLLLPHQITLAPCLKNVFIISWQQRC